MIVNFDSHPKNSIIYTTSIILSYLKANDGIANFEDLYKYCMDSKMDYSIFILTIDWMYLVGLVEEINNRNELVLCN
ncbi:hypothetical protein EHE19_019325 [Ruminiclostridium herbifermentans]|uniref:Uncharacterized protein n=1 Tax=Ruminiclostridium herbifermentans TaxID=2488810 RepID=A0A4U7J8I3_9FIRM|nr:ABC-three component system middle component 6 [Ruminiclostridium herbifermentans]QNU66947.1 hypothetical protein EHE19_019325 [Ruminiclostridium herbifermentans]